MSSDFSESKKEGAWRICISPLKDEKLSLRNIFFANCVYHFSSVVKVIEKANC